MAIYKYYVDNVSGATGNGGTGPADAFYTIQQAVDGVSADISDLKNIAFVYVKATGVTYSEENLSGFPTAQIRFIGTNNSFVPDGTRVTWANSTARYIQDYGIGGAPHMFFQYFNFDLGYSSGMQLQNSTHTIFQSCNFYGNSASEFVYSGAGGVHHGCELIDCYVEDFTQWNNSSSGRESLGLCAYSHFKNAMPRQKAGGTDLLYMINCIIEDEEVEGTIYQNFAFVNCLFKNSRLEIGDRSAMPDGYTLPFVINCSFVDSPTYAIEDTYNTEDDSLMFFLNNHFHGSVSGNFNFQNNFDIDDYPEAIAATADPVFRDETGGGTYGYAPTTPSILYGTGLFGNDIGPIKGVFTTTDTGSFDLGTGGAGDTVVVSGRSYQKVSDTPIVWRVS